MDLPASHPDQGHPLIAEPLCAIFRRKLKSDGLKYTPERARVLDAIIELDELFEAEELLSILRQSDHRVSKATVYRTIHLLQDAGIVQRVMSDRDQAQYQLVYGVKPHDLLIQLDSREVITISVPELVEIRERLAREHGLIAQGHMFQIFAIKQP